MTEELNSSVIRPFGAAAGRGVYGCLVSLTDWTDLTQYDLSLQVLRPYACHSARWKYVFFDGFAVTREWFSGFLCNATLPRLESFALITNYLHSDSSRSD
jgi:hypothetical protein